jgi:cyclic beta-1,2-glucan synthetase
MLDSSRGVLQAPIRSEIFGSTRFQQHGVSLANSHATSTTQPSYTAFFPRVSDNIRVLREAHHFIGLQELSGQHINPAGEWLLDNFHVVLTQVKDIHDGLPLRYFQGLPVLTHAPLAGLPRIYGFAWAFVAHTDSAFHDALLVDFLRAYQQVRELRLGELWALSTTLRVVLVENLRRLSERVAASKAARETANLWCDQSQERHTVALAEILSVMAARGVARPFALQVMQRLQSETWAPFESTASTRKPVVNALIEVLQCELADHAGAELAQQSEEAADTLSVSNAITALRSLSNADWRGLIGQISLLMQEMQASALFHAEREDTQDTTLHAIERLAKRSGLSERQVAAVLIDHLSPHPSKAALAPGYWLRGPGWPTLARALGVSEGLWRLRSARGFRVALVAYIGAITLGTLGLAAWWITRLPAPEILAAWPFWGVAALVWLALWPASEAVLALCNRLVSESVPPRRMPRLALEDGIPEEHRVLVVTPCMLSDRATIDALTQQLERHYLCNLENHAQFALLSDFTDAPDSTHADDAPLLAHALSRIQALHQRHPTDDGIPRFLLLHRARRWSQSEQRWIGWERKRGKLSELIDWLCTTADSPFVNVGALSTVRKPTPYLVTLDSDTVMPPGALRQLVGVASHPLNHPRVDKAQGRVVSGHGILQPRIVTPMTHPRGRTLYHWLFSGQWGIDPYSAVNSEIYQDVFDQGTFSGKGLLNVQAMHDVLSHQLPSELVLSHDLLEGCLSRCGGVSDITLIEDEPISADVAAARLHRWTRGDWQLLPVVLRSQRHHLSVLHNWKIFDNLRRSMVEPLCVILIVTCLAIDARLAWSALALVALAFAVGPLIGAVAGFIPHPPDSVWRHFACGAAMDLLRAVGASVWRMALLLAQAGMLTDAIARALYRMVVSHRHLLQWTPTAATVAAKVPTRTGRALSLGGQGRTVIAAALIAGGLLALDTPAAALALALCALWAGAPLWRHLASEPWRRAPTAREHLSSSERDYMRAVARDTWRLFEQHVGPHTNHLPPDNVQTWPHTMVAERTSPTNMGLYLLSTICAQAFGWIRLSDCLVRCEATLETFARMERYRGHFLNWYDTRDLTPLLPSYVSTVDSGNLCGHLLAVASACEEWAGQRGLNHEPEHTQDSIDRLVAIALTCRAFAMDAAFGFLFDPKRQLLHIGFRVAENELDRSYYDLLASEARLASLWAIAKGDIPAQHWMALGRPLFAKGAGAGLRSWSGSMFEYLMPQLTLEELPDSVLGQVGLSAVLEQMAYGQHTALPWGISESAYAASDHTLAYQYAPQGVPQLALRRTPPGELVIAPYATALAALWMPKAACANLRRLESMQARGAMGFIEALDFTAERQDGESTVTPVRTYMAHHQGMTIVALAQVLLDGAPRRWGMADARLASVATLLQERVPRELARLTPTQNMTPLVNDQRERFTAVTRELAPCEQGMAATQLLTNGRYSVALRANGAGWSRFKGVDISRWRDDALRDAHGSFLYIRHQTGMPPVSLTQHPAADSQAQYSATFHSDRAHFDAKWSDLCTRSTVWVSPEDDIELRQVELWNTTDHAISLELMSVFEVCLADARADETHPAFSNLFVQSDWDDDNNALYLNRQPRLSTEEGLHAVHFIAHADANLGVVRVQTDRARWLGRHRDASAPLAQADSFKAPSGACVTGLDPVAAILMQLTLPAHGRAQLTLGTAAALKRSELNTLVDRYQLSALIERSSLMSATLTGIRLREMRLPSEDHVAIRLLTTAMALTLTRPSTSLEPGQCNRQALWRLGISGDRPLIVVDISNTHGLRMMEPLVQALRLWTWGGLACDLVVRNAESQSYLMPLDHALSELHEHYHHDMRANVSAQAACGFYLLMARDLSETERHTMNTLARVQLNADGRSLSHHVQELAEWHDQAQVQRELAPKASLTTPTSTTPARPSRGTFEPTHGGFTFDVGEQVKPPRPWINVLANKDFGTQVSETGAGYSWALNSKLNQLSAWSNDPVSDPGGEHWWLQNERSGEAWSIGPGIAQAPTTYTVEHRPGRTTIGHRFGAAQVTATWLVDDQTAVKRVRIEIYNHGTTALSLRLASVVEWQMGALRSDRQSLCTSLQTMGPTPVQPLAVDALLATQQDGHTGFGGHTAFVTLRVEGATHARLHDWTCDRRELIDVRGWHSLPNAMGQRCGTGLDPCAAASVRLSVPAKHSQACVFTLGYAPSLDEAKALAHHTCCQDATQQETTALAHWEQLLGAVSVKTPDPLFDVMVNHWLLYQAVACRLWARTGFYQAGGAVGFRDQLQDAMALAVSAPHLLREQLLLAASRQFVPGDVQHWWHGPLGAGVRTHCSDDLLWLPHAALHYVFTTQDSAVWNECVPFLDGQAIEPEAEDAYFVPQVSTEQATLYEHCARALDHSMTAGTHGLPLIGSGDWNDGMNRVGHLGRGESVWLAWFLCLLVQDFAPVAQAHGDTERAQRWRLAARGWRQALTTTAWDGEWFARAYFDDGTPLGVQSNSNCRIDLIAQAWSVLSGVATPEQQTQAMASVRRWLIDTDAGLVRLLDPPLNGHVPDAGYIQAYPAGVRENGGQYNHAAVWALMAQAQLGDGDAAYETFTRLSPAHRSASASQGVAYGLEPYAMAGDIYTHAPYVGRGGWSWYTGCAAWMHRAATESLCGLRIQGSQVCWTPQLPSHWSHVQVQLLRGGAKHHFWVCKAHAKEAIAQAHSQGATSHQPGEWFELGATQAGHSYLITIATREPQPANPASTQKKDKRETAQRTTP